MPDHQPSTNHPGKRPNMDDNKYHSACDECRKRKLKCSGQSAGCARCLKQNLTCHYSLQKQMGRPRKRQKVADESGEGPLMIATNFSALVAIENSPSQGDPVYSACQMFDEISDPEPIFNVINSYGPQLRAPFQNEDQVYEQIGSLSNNVNDGDSNITPSSHSPTTPSLSALAESFPFSLDWTNYSTMSSLPIVATESPGQEIPPSKHPHCPTSIRSPTNNPLFANCSIQPQINPFTAAPSCTCLADLYLSLSSLSNLPSHRINPHAVEVLQAATRTAHAVLYCPTCPQKFQSGMQNIMLLATILPVIADGWSRILRTPAQDLARGFDTDPTTTLLSDADLAASWTDAKEAQWKLFTHYLVRQYVFGDTPPPGTHLPGICPSLSTSPARPKPPIIILNNLCEAMERRQKSWHGLIKATGEFPEPCVSGDDALLRSGERSCGKEHRARGMTQDQCEKKEYLCLKIVESMRSGIALMDISSDPGGMTGEQVRLSEVVGR